MESILADSKRLGAEIDKVTYTSNYFPQMLDLAERLIKAGHLYADDTPQETMKEVIFPNFFAKFSTESVFTVLHISVMYEFDYIPACALFVLYAVF